MFIFYIYLILTFLLIIPAGTEIAILAKGIGFIEEDDIAMIFYITVKNICKDDLELSTNMVQCCETLSSDEIDCNSMTLIGGDMGTLPSTYVKNLTLIYPNIYLFNRRGICTIEVAFRNQLKKREIRTDVHFDTSKSCSKNHRRQQCESNDLYFKENCNPVDCLIKYSGTNSYFNPECKRCQKVATCISKNKEYFPDIAYSPYNNECIDINAPISKQDLVNIESTSPECGQTAMTNAICHYGKVMENGKCLCNDGWATTTNDEGMYEPTVAQYHMCNVQIGDWNYVNKGRIRITAILIAVFAITVISKILLLMCIMTWCYKHFRKPQEVCARELDSDDQSIVLCDKQRSFDQCLCCEEDGENDNSKEETARERPGERRLRTQTVNISYFPCSPSAFSSMKTSTGSSKYSTKTDASIDLSHTTTSPPISFPEGESSDESENTNDTVYCEDAGSNDVVYGVFCGVDGTDRKLVGEEVEEEEDEEEVGQDEEDEYSTDNRSREIRFSEKRSA